MTQTTHPVVSAPLIVLMVLVLAVDLSYCADKVQVRKNPQQGGDKVSPVKLAILKVMAGIFGTAAVIIVLYVTRSKWCCIQACRGQGFLKNKIKTQIDAYMPGMRVNDDTGQTEYYEPTHEEMAALGSVLHVIKDMATLKQPSGK